MKRTLCLIVALALAAACGGPSPSRSTEKAELPSNVAPKFEKTKTIREVLDSKTRTRVGFIEKTTYNDGMVVYWVTDTDRSLHRGYVLTNGQAYQFEWVAGRRRKDPVFLGADTLTASARKIIGYDQPVVFRATTIQALMKEYQPKQTTKAGPAESAEEEE